MLQKFKTLFLVLKWHLIDKPTIKKLSKKSFEGLTNTSFSIFASNCAAGFIYQDAGLPYTTPTIGLFFHSPCFIELLENFSWVNDSLKFVHKSKYESTNIARQKSNNYYPIAIIGNDIEIHFLHYTSEAEAKEKWQRRLAKLNYDNLLILFSVREKANESLVQRFDQLPFKNKLCLSALKYENIKSLIHFKQYEKDAEMPGADVARISVLRKVKFATILNNLK